MQTVTAWNGSSQTYLYDALGRVIQKTENIDNVPYTTAYGYDSKGNNTSVDYQASGFGIRRSFNDNGYLTKITNTTNTTTIFDATDAANTIVNALGQYASYKLSNGNIIVNNTYNAYGMPTQFRARKATDAATTYSIQNYQTNFDLQTGNLLSRRDIIANLQEFFTYDANSRLLNNTATGTTAGVAPFSITFADNGNINNKTDIGDYTYSSSKIHAVTGVQNTNQPISLRQQDISYSAFQQPTFITEPQANNAANVYGLTYTYGADYQRVKALLTLNGTQQSVRHYLGSYEKNTIGATTEWVHYVSAADGLAAIVTITNNAAPAYHYVFKDHLGSILRVTNATGTTEADQSFDAWGRRRNPTTWAYTNANAPTQTWLYRGYTAHEHLDQFALINMNGRLYDPTVGRMLSPDNYVQDALYAQTFNRYAYAHNNPLKYVDPDGEFAIIDSWITGFVHGFFSKGDNRWENAWQEANRRAGLDVEIWGGLFVTDKNKSFGGRVWELVSRFTWQLPQTLGGFLAAQTANTVTGTVTAVDYLHGATVTQTRGEFGAITLGSFILGDNDIRAEDQNPLFQHEYGHYLQSQRAGLAYIPMYGIPSLISAMVTTNPNSLFFLRGVLPFQTIQTPNNHNQFWTERDANLRSFNYMQRHHLMDSEDWFEQANPLAENVSNPMWYDYLFFPFSWIWHT